MSDEIPNKNTGMELHADKMQRFVRAQNIPDAHNPKWSRFVRRMRLILPVIAIALFAVVFVWSDVQRNNIIPAKPAEKNPTVGKNELLNPKFESTDSDNQPFTLTAKRAVQDASDNNLVLMEEPLADMLLNSGDWVALKADKGDFRQNERTLALRGKVRLYHDKGYQLETEELDLNLRDSTGVSKTDIHGQGPQGTLESKGLEGNATNGSLIFNGPAKLVLTNVSGNKGLLP